MRNLHAVLLSLAIASLSACSSSDPETNGAAGGGNSGAGKGATGGADNAGSNNGGADSAGADSAGADNAGASASDAGWLYTTGNEIHVSNGGKSGPRWMGRGVNLDDLFLCGYNYKLETPDAAGLLKTEIDGLFQDWKPNFVRVSLGMKSYAQVSWLGDDAAYKAPMTDVIRAIGAHPNSYVLVSLRSDASMIGHDPENAEPTGMPSDSTTTPDQALFPTGTDAVYVALVDSFAHDNFVLFGITNEAGGNASDAATIRAAMAHAVSVIRAEEDKLGVPHHLVSVQGKGYTGDISFWADAPLEQDNVVYEVHGYPPPQNAYTYANLPVILGEYGSLDAAGAALFFQDVESKQIPNLAWDFEPFSDCAPDLLEITTDASQLVASDWGKLVQPYLLSHAAP